jgi:hypothetical protein
MRPTGSIDCGQQREDAPRDIGAAWTEEALKRIIDELVVPALVNEYLRLKKPLPEADTHES